jgi:hypothetical protein
MNIEDKLKELIENVEMVSSQLLHYFAYNKRILNDAIIYFKNSDVIVVDRKGNKWQRGQKLKEECGVICE